MEPDYSWQRKHYLERELNTIVRRNIDIFQFIEEGALDGLWYWDLLKPDNEWMSPKFWRTLGFDPKDKEHNPAEWKDLIHPDDLLQSTVDFELHCANPDHPYDHTVRYKHRDGSTVWIRCRGLAIRDVKGRAIRMLGAHQDITHLKKAELESHNARERFELAVKGTSVGIWDWIDVTKEEQYWSPRFYELLGYDDKEVAASRENFEALLHAEDRSRANASLKAHFDTNETFSIHCRLRTRQGKYRWFHASGYASRHESGKPIRMVGSIEDVHERFLAQEENERMIARLAKSNSDLEKFAYVASHDLKAPLRAIKQLASWIAEDIQSPGEQLLEHLNLMQGRVTRMETLLEDLLEYSRAGREKGDFEKVNLQRLVEDILEYLNPPHRFKVELETRDIVIETLQVPMELVLRNIIGNALKHHDKAEGKILVSAVLEKDFVVIRVEDDGPGIAPEHAQVIFDLFHTLAPRDSVEGSGMGLSIVKKTVQDLGGAVQLMSVDDLSPGMRCGFQISWPTQFPELGVDGGATSAGSE